MKCNTCNPVRSAHAKHTKRISSIDIAKGIGIFLVVIGHNRIITSQAPFIHSGIFLFHMPLFFFLSGLVTTTPFNLKSLKLKISGLARPYLSGLIIFLPLQIYHTEHFSNHPFLENIFWGSGNSLYGTPIWFLTALISSYATLWLIVNLIPTKRAIISIILSLLIIASTYFTLETKLGYEWLPKNQQGHPLGAPLNFDLALLGAAFLLLGSTFSRVFKAPASTKIVATIGALSSLIFVLLMLNSNPQLDLNHRYIDRWNSVFLCTTTGICAISCLSIELSKSSTTIRRIFEYFGQNTLIILVFHAPIQNYLTLFLSKYTVTALIPAFFISTGMCFLLSWISDRIINQAPHLRKFFYAK